MSCHEDLTATDLVGRYLLLNDETVWSDGPLTRAVRHGAILYLDEVVEARKDTTVVIHALTDHRRLLTIEKTGEQLTAHADFLLVISYNPGYQSVLKDLKPSTRQRFVTLPFHYPPLDAEAQIVAHEGGVDAETARRLAELGHKVRQLEGQGLNAVGGHAPPGVRRAADRARHRATPRLRGGDHARARCRWRPAAGDRRPDRRDRAVSDPRPPRADAHSAWSNFASALAERHVVVRETPAAAHLIDQPHLRASLHRDDWSCRRPRPTHRARCCGWW